MGVTVMMITALSAGAIFVTGPALAGMLNPVKVAGFLDIFGMWNLSLGLVMADSNLVKGTGHYFVMKHNLSIFNACFDLPSSNNIDRPLLIGTAIFAIGWGLAGFCPGLVVASLLLQPADMLPFLGTLLAGAFLGHWFRSQGYKR